MLTGLVTGDAIERIDIEGNKKISRDTILFYMKSRENTQFIEEKVREDMKILWETGFFETIRIESRDGRNGKILKVVAIENPLISSVTYKIGKKVKETDITTKLQENNISLVALSYFSPVKLKKAEGIIRAFLLEKGFNDGKVEIDKKINNEQVSLVIQIDPGSKTKIGVIDFPGLNPKLVSPSALHWGMKNNKQHDFLSVVQSKDVYNREKIEEDLEEVRIRLQQRGYMEARVGTPEFGEVRKLTLAGKSQKMMKISIPIELGPQYKLNSIKVEGTKVIKPDYLKSFFKMKPKQIYNAKKRKKAIEEINKFYGGLGYLYCQANAQENLDPVNRMVDLVVNIHEGEVVFVGKLEFRGNTFTKDHVLRREWFLREGMRMSTSALENSIRRMKQLGLVTVDKMPDLKPDPQNPQKVDIVTEVKEMNRQMINFNVGYSGYQGLFVSLGYSTQNFLGMGEQLSINFLHGTRSKDYQFAFTEPYLFNLPANFGFDVFRTHTNIPGYPERKDEGFTLSSSWRFWKYWGTSISYGLQFTETQIPTTESETGEIVPSPYYSIWYYPGKRNISYISPTIQYTTVDSPIFPSSGVKYLLNYRFSGGPLGGDIYMHKVKLEFVKFQPLWRRHTLGFHLVYQGLKTFGGKNDYPYYERFILGGEQSIRGYDYWRIGPRDENGNVYGGNKAFFFNFEYAFTMTEQFALVAFYDIGNSYLEKRKISFNDVYTSAGLELRVYLPMLGVPIRLILAYNNRRIYETDQKVQFKFAIGPSFY